MQSKSITVFDKTIRTDADGRFCLNDLHKAAMANGKATKSQRPGVFLDSNSVKGFIAELDETDAAFTASVKSIKGGRQETRNLCHRAGGVAVCRMDQSKG